jgi:hypothetical protein
MVDQTWLAPEIKTRQNCRCLNRKLTIQIMIEQYRLVAGLLTAPAADDQTNNAWNSASSAIAVSTVRETIMIVS